MGQALNAVLWIVPLYIVSRIVEVEMTTRVILLCIASEILSKIADRITDGKPENSKEKK